RELLDIRQENNFTKFSWDPIEGGQHILILNIVRNRRLECQRLLERLFGFRNRFAIEPTPAVVPDFIDKDLEQPGSAVGTGLETMKRLPCLQIRLLYKIMSFRPVPHEVHRCPVKIVQMRQCYCFERVRLDFSSKYHLLWPPKFFSCRYKPWNGCFIP